MKKYIILFIFLSFIFTIKAQQNASCMDFSKTSVDILTENNYLPDGKYNSIKLRQGDKIEVYKPFYRGKKYYLIITSDENLPGIIVELKDISRQIIFQSEEASIIHEFEYNPDKNQNLIISVQVIESEDFDASEQGCVSIVVGFRT